jgi:hypothetical protein
VRQKQFFSRGSQDKIARATWQDSVLEESIVKVVTDGLDACRIPNVRIRERIPRCYRCHAFVGQAGKKGIPDVLFWIPRFYKSIGMRLAAPNSVAHMGAFEIKRPAGGVEGIEQKEMLEEIRKAGGIAEFIRSWDEAKAAIEAKGYRLPI